MDILTNEERIAAATHAIQTGCKFTIELDMQEGHDLPWILKHHRTGIDSSFATSLGLAELLIAKGVFTREEYTAYCADAYEKEVKRYETVLSTRLGTAVTLG